jgi:sugar/nucleoside kinase (ribokinase family)
MVLWDRDARMSVRELAVDDSMLASARVVHVDDVDVTASITLANFARERGSIVTSDIDAVTDRTLELVASVTIPIFAEEVPRALTGIADPEGALRALRPYHGGLLCVTLGARGAMALDGDRVVQAPGFPVDAVDTTGAGDVFRAGLIYAVLAGFPVERMLRFANAAAAASCTRLGAIASVPALAEVMRVLGEGHG